MWYGMSVVFSLAGGGAAAWTQHNRAGHNLPAFPVRLSPLFLYILAMHKYEIFSGIHLRRVSFSQNYTYIKQLTLILPVDPHLMLSHLMPHYSGWPSRSNQAPSYSSSSFFVIWCAHAAVVWPQCFGRYSHTNTQTHTVFIGSSGRTSIVCFAHTHTETNTRTELYVCGIIFYCPLFLNNNLT